MEKKIRHAVRCFLIEDNKVVVTKYKEKNRKEGYYEIPGGKIEENETSIDTCIREMREETGINIFKDKIIKKGIMEVEYPDRIYMLDIFLTKDYEGIPRDFEENSSKWIDINELLSKEKLLSNIIILDRFFIKGLIDEKLNFNMYIKVDEDEKILEIKYNLLDV